MVEQGGLLDERREPLSCLADVILDYRVQAFPIFLLQRENDARVHHGGFPGMLRSDFEGRQVVEQKTHHGIVRGEQDGVGRQLRKGEMETGMLLVGRDVDADLLTGLFDEAFEVRVIRIAGTIDRESPDIELDDKAGLVPLIEGDALEAKKIAHALDDGGAVGGADERAAFIAPANLQHAEQLEGAIRLPHREAADLERLG